MPWNNQKSTFDSRPSVPSDEKLTASEWNTHVADQEGRVPYGPLADRPAAADADNGDVWLVTDLANDAGILTKHVSGSWELMGLGDSSNRIPDVYAETVDTGSITDSDDGSAWETLREAGYETGDVVPIASFPVTSGIFASTTSTSYTDTTSIGYHIYYAGALIPDVSSLKAAVFVDVSAGGGETMDIRYRDKSKNETVVEITDVTTKSSSGWVNYSPSNPNGASSVMYQQRTNPGGNSSTTNRAVLMLGVEI